MRKFKKLQTVISSVLFIGMTIPAYGDNALEELENYVIDNAQAIVDAGEARKALQRKLQQLQKEKQELKATVDQLFTRLDQLTQALEQSTALIKAYADTKASEAAKAAKAHADTKARQAEHAAKAHANTKASQAEHAAKAHANSKVNNLGEKNCHWRGYHQKWDLVKDDLCPSGYYLKGVGFKHANDYNHTHEESFRIYCCRLK